MNFAQIKSQRRRSQRVTQSIPLIVRGIDILGQPFEERTSTLVVNLHGCRYASKHHLPGNTWVTLEVAQGSEFYSVRARIAWVQRPQTIRDFFQVAVELESAVNIWGVDLPQEVGVMEQMPTQPFEVMSEPQKSWNEPAPQEMHPPVIGSIIEDNTPSGPSNVSLHSEPDPSFQIHLQEPAAGENPLLRDLTAELNRQAKQAVESATAEAMERIRRAAEESEQKKSAAAEDFFQRWKEEFDRAQSDARDEFSTQLAARQTEFLAGLTSKFEEGFQEAQRLIQELDQKTQRARAELEFASAATQAPQIQFERPSIVPDPGASLMAGWNDRLQSEMALAQSQWNELLQSSLDGGMQRLAEQLADRSRDVLRNVEQKMTERIAELRQPMAETLTEARDTLNHVRSALEHEMGQARTSLADIEHVASRVKDYSSQLDVSTHDTLNELHRRIENILESQTDEMNRRAENLISGVAQRLHPTIDSLGHQLVERAVSEVESRIAPHLDRVPDLLRDLAAREVQVEEGLRLHRERLRQISENNQREVNAQAAAALSTLKNNFEAARQDSLPKWNEDLSASGAKAIQTVAESMRENSDWFQQDTQARLQVMVEQTLTAAQSNCDDVTAKAAFRFGDELENRSAARVTGIERQLDKLSHEVSGRVRTQMDAASESAAASFGHLLSGISEQEAQQFGYAAQDRLRESSLELERSAQVVLGNFSASAEISLEQFRGRLASQVEASLADGREAVSTEFGALLNQFVAERDVRQQEWTRGLERISDEATERHQGRLQNTADSWMVSSVRRLNEHGQNVIESLMRSSDQALRDSCVRVFEGLADMMRERTTNAAGASAFPNENNNRQTSPDNSGTEINTNWTNA